MVMMNRGGSREKPYQRPPATHATRSQFGTGPGPRARTDRSECTGGAWWIHLCWMPTIMVQHSLTVSSQSVSLHARQRVRKSGIRQGAQKHLSRESCNRTRFKMPCILGRYMRIQFNNHTLKRAPPRPICLQERKNHSPLLHKYCTIIQERNT
jgi:hypothetical protein